MKLEQKIGQRLMIGLRGPSLDHETRAHLYEISPGGVILFLVIRALHGYSCPQFLGIVFIT